MAAQVAAADFHLTVELRHFEYLAIQQGRLYDLREDFPNWQANYTAGLAKSYQSMRSALPAECQSILDIGSGLGGIDVLLSRHYGGAPFVNLVDGADDPPRVEAHNRTFNNMEVALDFQRKNGIKKVGFCTPDALFTPRPMDLIISQASWCFHYNPETYLDWVLACCHPATVLILDVRRDYATWQRVLAGPLEPIAVLQEEHKFTRRAYRPRG